MDFKRNLKIKKKQNLIVDDDETYISSKLNRQIKPLPVTGANIAKNATTFDWHGTFIEWLDEDINLE